MTQPTPPAALATTLQSPVTGTPPLSASPPGPQPIVVDLIDTAPVVTPDAHRKKRGRIGDTGREQVTTDKSSEREREQRKVPNRRPNFLVGPQEIRYIAPLPSRATRPDNEMSLPIHLFDPNDFTNLPNAIDENPHTRRTREGGQPALPNLTFTPFTDTAFHAASIPTFKLRGNIADQQLAALDANKSEPLYIVFHGGGQRVLKRAPEKIGEIQDLIRSFRFDCHGDAAPIAMVLAPIAKNASDRKRFGQPWTLFLILGPEEDALRKFLLWQHVFAIHPTLSFSVHQGAPGQPWPVMVLTGAEGAVEDSDDAKKEVLATIKARLWSNMDFCVLAANLVAKNWGAAGNMAKLAKLATDSLDAHYVRAELSGSEKLVPAYLIIAKPLTEERGDHKRWIEHFTAPGEYWRGVHQLKVNVASVDCKLCKEATHCACDCPLPATAGWQGPTAKDIYQKEQEDLAAGTDTTAAPSQQAAEIWRQVPRKGDKQRKGAKGRGPMRKGQSSGKDSRPKRR